jgi:nitroimidazol reductase NimA-like FMN-containing flavoprotein (pyridoxamine 5'-phosphate oxidase superfamily)
MSGFNAGRGMQRARSEGKSRLTRLVHERRFLTSLRVAHLATADTGAIPDVVPVCFVVCADTLYVTIGSELKCIRNIMANPRGHCGRPL